MPREINARKKLGVLVSGNGSNLQAIIDQSRSTGYPAEVAVVVSSHSEARALERARAAGIPGYAVERADFASNNDHNGAILDKLKEHGVDLIVLAGYMRLVGSAILDTYRDAVINLHPSLLPSFPGAHAIKDALEAGVKITGITIHFADETYDTGPIIIQEVVPVQQEDTEETLGARVHKVEHRHLPYAVKLWASGRLRIVGRRVNILPKKDRSAGEHAPEDGH